MLERDRDVMRAARVSHEARLLARLRECVFGIPGLKISSAQGAANRFDIPGWELPAHQRFQYGDLRIETPVRIILIETESAGGVTNLVKYWPLWAAEPPAKRVLLVHLYQLNSAGDYVAHRRLWHFIVERMREHLAERGVRWGNHWEAELLTYRTEADMDQVAQFVQAAVRG